jgi:hypothetical protein
LNDSDCESSDGGSVREDDITLLYSAVEAIGTNQWHVISKEWFNGRLGENDLKTMWENSTDKSIVYHEKNPYSQITATSRGMSIRRRNEEETIEMRKLFATNARSEEDMDLIYRAYLVGNERLEKILRMNSAPRRNENLQIFLSSIIVEMKNISHESLSSYKLSISKCIKKLPQSDLPNDNTISPLRGAHESFSDHRCLRFSSTRLPVLDIIMKEIVYSEDNGSEDMKSLNSNEDDLLQFTSCETFVVPIML